MSGWIIKHFPHNYECMNYVEPFCGSAVVLLNKKKSRREIINDFDKNIFYVYRALRERDKELIKMLDKTLYSENEVEYSRKILDNKIKVDDWILYAWAKIVNIKISVNNIGNVLAASKEKVLEQNRQKYFRNYNKIIDDVLSRLRDVVVLNKDASKVVKKYDDDNTFFYIDPPYPNADQDGYYKKYSMEDFNNLCKILDNIKGKYLLSCYLVDGMSFKNNRSCRYYYHDDVKLGARIKKKSREFLISNYEVKE